MKEWIGKKIKDLYQANEYTQESFAEKPGYSDTKTIRNACKGIISDMKVMGIQVNYLNGGCGVNYGANGNYSNWYGLVRSVVGTNLAYQAMADEEEFTDYVVFISISGQFDSEYNMPYTSKARSTVKEHIGKNSVNLGTQGYNQIANAAFRNMCAMIP